MDAQSIQSQLEAKANFYVFPNISWAKYNWELGQRS